MYELTNDGWVVYTRESQNPYWERVRKQRGKEVEDNASFARSSNDRTRYYHDAAETLRQLAINERSKEAELIFRLTGKRPSDDEEEKDFIQHFNEILIGAKQFEQTVQRLKQDLKKREKDKDKHSLAPQISSLFLPKYQSILGHAVENWFHTRGMENFDESIIEWKNGGGKEVAIECAIQAFSEILTNPNTSGVNKIYHITVGNNNDYKDLAELFKSNSDFQRYFSESILSKLGINNINNLFDDQQAYNKFISSWNYKSRNYGPTAVKKALKVSSKRTGQIGGTVAEYVLALMEGIIGGTYVIDDKGTTKSGSVVAGTSEIAKTDVIATFSFDAEIDAEQVCNDIIDQVYNETNKSLIDTARRLDEVTRETLSKLKDNFIVYTSSKAYGLGDNFRGFRGGKQLLSTFPATTEEMYSGTGNIAEKLVAAAYNVIPGAILEENNEIVENLKQLVSMAAAALLFDDYLTIGKGINDNNSIHVLSLDSIQLPLSVYMKACADAILDTVDELKSLVQVNIKLGGKILYPNVSSYNFNNGEHITKMDINEAWEKQAQNAVSSSKFEITFLSNFKDRIISKL